MADDWELIVASFQSQYGIRLAKELDDMSWAEFSALLGSVGYETPLGRIVAIRSERDPEVVRKMSPEQKRIRSEWRRKQFQKNPPKDATSFIADMQNFFAGMSRGKD